MTTEISALLAAAAAPTAKVVDGITDEQLSLPTPCAQYRVRDLVNHLFQVVVNFQALATRQPADWATTPDRLDAGWRDRFAAETGALVSAWSDPASLEGVSPSMRLPQSTVAAMVLLDLTVHGWDLARATDQEYEADPASVTALHELVAVMGPQAREAGVFGDEVPVPPGSDDLASLLALTGRPPSWDPAPAVGQD